MKATGTHKAANWQESTVEDPTPKTRISKVSTGFEITGGITGLAKTEYLMYYSHLDAKDMHLSTAAYVGYANFNGSIGGQEGHCVLEDRGTFKDGAARSSLKIVDGSGTGGLKGIRGSGLYTASMTGSTFELEYELGS